MIDDDLISPGFLLLTAWCKQALRRHVWARDVIIVETELSKKKKRTLKSMRFSEES